MENQSTVLVGGGVGAAFSITAFIILRFVIPFFNAANHKRIRSVCCGRTCITSLDVEETTPQVVTTNDTLTVHRTDTSINIKVPKN
jgi:hypothetical protein